jgi:hypothetical protein
MSGYWRIGIRTCVIVGCLWLCGCMGGPLAQQLLASAVMQGTDSIIDHAYIAGQRDADQRRKLPDTTPNPYWASFVTAGFERITPIEAPLPTGANSSSAEAAHPSEPSVPTSSPVQAAPLVRVEVWNMLLGEEKLAVLERANAMGNPELPPRTKWTDTTIATGAIMGDDQQQITFLVPAQLGRPHSGQWVVVELGHDLNIARYSSLTEPSGVDQAGTHGD